MQVLGNLSAMLTAAQGRWLSFEQARGKVGCGGGI